LSQGVAGYITEFSETDVGKKMHACAIKDYEKNRLTRIAKEYDKVIFNQACQEVIDMFLRCYELSIMPVDVAEKLERLHVMFKNKYPGLAEFSHENKYSTMQVKHIFYPSIEPKFNENYQIIDSLMLMDFIMMGMVRLKNQDYLLL